MTQHYTWPTWDQKITICTNERRLRYCAKTVMRVCKPGTEAHEQAREALHWIDNGGAFQGRAYHVEKWYRVYVYAQRVGFA